MISCHWFKWWVRTEQAPSLRHSLNWCVCKTVFLLGIPFCIHINLGYVAFYGYVMCNWAKFYYRKLCHCKPLWMIPGFCFYLITNKAAVILAVWSQYLLYLHNPWSINPGYWLSMLCMQGQYEVISGHRGFICCISTCICAYRGTRTGYGL